MQRLFATPPWVLATGLFLITAALYTWRLDRGPVYFGGDEAHFVSHAHSIAQTGRDLNGTRLPLFVKITDLQITNHSSRIWYQPVLFYLLALDFTFFDVNEWSARLPTTLIAALNVMLVYLLGRRLFKEPWVAAFAAGVLLLTPAHFIMSRQALDYICPLPIVLAWLLAVVIYIQTGRERALVIAALLLGAGLYTYISSWFVMPFLGVATVVILRPPWRLVARCAFAFALPALLVLPWLIASPQMLTDTLGRYRLNAGDASPGADAFSLGERISLFWDYFNPSFLFFAGGSNPTMATARVGIFLMPVAVFLAAGIAALLRQRSRTGALLLLGFAAAPLPIALTMPDAASYSVPRAFTMVPFGALIAAYGCEVLFAQRATLSRAAAAALLLAMPLQYAAFLHDYFTDYQLRSSARIDPMATRDVMARVMEIDAARPAPLILFADDLDDRSVRWRFYSLKLHREDLWTRSRHFDPDRFTAPDAPADSLLVLYAADPRIERLMASAACERVAEVASVSGEPAAAILRRVERTAALR